MGTCPGSREKEDIDPYYDTFEKLTIQKDGLDIYKTKKSLKSNGEIRCPLLKNRLTDEEMNILNNQINKVDKNILSLLTEYNNLINSNYSEYSIDIFKQLEELYNKIESAKVLLEENRYFLHICKNQQIYLDISKFDKNYDYYNLIYDKRYIYEKWNNNNNLKNILINERKNKLNQKKIEDEKRERLFRIEERKKEIEKKYEGEFEQYGIETESDLIILAKGSIDQNVKYIDWTTYDESQKKNKAYELYDVYARPLKFKINRDKIKDYIQQIVGCCPPYTELDSYVLQEEIFHSFVRKKDSEYNLLCNNNFVR